MRRALVLLASLAVLCVVASPATAHTSRHAITDPAPEIFPVGKLSLKPPGFRLDAGQALALAETSPTMLAIHRVHHPLQWGVFLWIGNHYEIYFWWHHNLIGDVIVNRNGTLGPTYTGPEILGVYARGHYGEIFDSPWVWLSFGVMFLVPVVFLRRRSLWDTLDLLVLLSWGVSYVIFDQVHIELAVWLAYPPLLYLLVRMLVRGRRPHGSGRWIDCRLPLGVLAVGLVALVAARVYVTLQPSNVMDVGEASIVGAYKIVHGQSIYYSSLGHGDTYGPIAYLAYAPFELIWPGDNWASYLPSVRAATITFDMLTIGGLILLGMRLRPGRDGRRLGLLMAWLWAACPFSVLGLVKSTNDGLVAMLVVFAMLALNAPIRRGAVLGLAAAAKFFPAILLPLFAAGGGGEGRSGARKALAGFVIVSGLSIALFLPPGGLREMFQHTIGYQLTRTDIFSPWALHPSLAPVKIALEVGAAALAVLVAFRPRGRRSTAQVSALAAALIIAVQLPALHWFYLYIVWFLPLVLIAVLGAEPRPTTPDRPVLSEPRVQVAPAGPEPEPVPAG